jgi:hypothetical protein
MSWSFFGYWAAPSICLLDHVFSIPSNGSRMSRVAFLLDSERLARGSMRCDPGLL